MKGQFATIKLSAEDGGITVRVETLNHPDKEYFVRNGETITANFQGDIDSETDIIFVPRKKGASQNRVDLSPLPPEKPRGAGCALWILIIFFLLVSALLKLPH